MMFKKNVFVMSLVLLSSHLTIKLPVNSFYQIGIKLGALNIVTLVCATAYCSFSYFTPN